MIALFEFIYYCLYRLFSTIKRVGEKDENLASSFFSILLSTNTSMLFFALRYILPKGYFTPYPYNYLLKIIFVSPFIFWYLFCKSYFLKKENFIRIINHYEVKYSNRNSQMVLIGILYTLVTFISFICLAMILSRL